jgi:hypothetical protein
VTWVIPAVVTGVRGGSTNEPLLKRLAWHKLIAVENKLKVAGGMKMTEFLRKTRAPGAVVSVAEYVVMLFVAVMTGVSTLRLLGILP